MGIAVSITNDASVNPVVPRANMPDKKPLLVSDVGNGDRLDAKEHENLVEGREIGDEM